MSRWSDRPGRPAPSVWKVADRLLRRLAAAGLIAGLATTQLAAQVTVTGVAGACDRARAGLDVDDLSFCTHLARGVEDLQPQLGAATWGGNPVPGTASTLGMRLGSVPRVSIALRGTAAELDVPRVETREAAAEGTRNGLAYSINVDGAVGVFSGFSPLPTVGGLLSLDALAGIGYLSLPQDEGFGDGDAFSWGIGARLGLLRESFTLPGVSVSAMYRTLPDIELASTDGAGSYEADLKSLSLRAGVSKRILTLGVAGGIGYDRYRSDGTFGFRQTDGGSRQLEIDDFSEDRLSYFGSISWTLLVVHLVGEVGWQEALDEDPALGPPDPGGTLYGSLAVRLSI